MFKKRNIAKKAIIDDIITDINANQHIHSHITQQSQQQHIGRNTSASVHHHHIQTNGTNTNNHISNNSHVNVDVDVDAEVDVDKINEFIQKQNNKMNKIDGNRVSMDMRQQQQQMHGQVGMHKYDYAITDSERLKEEDRKQIQHYFDEYMREQHTDPQPVREQHHTMQDEHNDYHISNGHAQVHQQQYNPFLNQAHQHHIQQHHHSQQYVQQHNNYNQQQHHPAQRPAPMVQQIIIEDQSADHIQVREDYGEISPDNGSQSQNYEEGYENQIIKKTLTRHNYMQISNQLSTAHAQQRKNKLIKQLNQISYSNVQRKIAKDLRTKKNTKDELLNQIKYIDKKIENRQKEIQTKLANKDRLQTDIDQVRRILQTLYYFGSQLDRFDQKSLMELITEEDWRERIDRVRANIKRNKDKFDIENGIKQKGDDDEKEKSEGDVEEIPRQRINNKWDLDEDGDEGEVGDHHQNGYNDDDEQDFDVDDD